MSTEPTSSNGPEKRSYRNVPPFFSPDGYDFRDTGEIKRKHGVYWSEWWNMRVGAGYVMKNVDGSRIGVSRRDTEGDGGEDMAAIPDDPLAEAENIVQRCIDEGNEYINLADLRLQDITPSIIHSLALLTKPTPAATSPTNSPNHPPPTPALHILLAHNALHSVPPQLFDLTSLTALSLYNNKLTTLPEAFGQLQNLLELNVGGNQLRWLPWGVLKLALGEGKLEKLETSLNPFLEPENEFRAWEGRHGRWEQHPGGPSEPEEIRNIQGDPLPMAPVLIASTPRSYFLPTLSLHPASPPPPSLTPEIETILPNIDPSSPPNPPPSSATGPLPLLSLTLHALLRAYSSDPDFSTLSSFLPPDSIPQRLLGEAMKARGEGGRLCTVCGREYVVHRTEWMEWWDLNPDCPSDEDEAIPVLRRGCRWSCVA